MQHICTSVISSHDSQQEAQGGISCKVASSGENKMQRNVCFNHWNLSLMSSSGRALQSISNQAILVTGDSVGKVQRDCDGPRQRSDLRGPQWAECKWASGLPSGRGQACQCEPTHFPRNSAFREPECRDQVTGSDAESRSDSLQTFKFTSRPCRLESRTVAAVTVPQARLGQFK